MARIARVIAPGMPHHITQRGNRRQLISIVRKSWPGFLTEKITFEEQRELQKHERTGRPLGNLEFIERLEKMLNLKLKPGKPGKKTKNKN